VPDIRLLTGAFGTEPHGGRPERIGKDASVPISHNLSN